MNTEHKQNTCIDWQPCDLPVEQFPTHTTVTYQCDVFYSRHTGKRLTN